MTRTRRSLPALVALTTTLLLSACGGGGGGGGTRGNSVKVTTNPSAGSGGQTGQSERVTIYSSTGAQLTQRVVNLGSTPSTTTLAAPSGAYYVRVELNSAADFGGAVTGILQQTVVSGSTDLTIDVGPAAQSIRLTPTTLNLNTGQTMQLGVSGVDSNGNLTFLAPGSVSYTVVGVGVTVNENGLLTTSAVGTAVVTAHGANSLAATANVSVAEAGTTRSKWTVMVYLNAGNNLYPYAKPNVNQMERVAGNKDVRFVLQWKESGALYGMNNVDFDGTKRFLVKPDSGPDNGVVASQMVQDMGTNVDMGKASTLHDFVGWAKQHYPADHYVLIIWNHGNGWQRSRLAPPPVRAVSYDDQFNSFIDIWDLPTALADEHVDILSFDACLMQMLEIASDVKGVADYVATSEENTPGPGYPYHRVFKAFADNPNGTPRELSKGFVDGHVGYSLYQDLPVTQSVIDTSKVPAIETAIDNLAAALILERPQLGTAIPDVRSLCPKYADPNDGRYFYDLVDVCQRLQASSSVPADVKTAAGAVATAVTNAVVWNGATTRSSFSHGLAIDFSPSTGPEMDVYANLNLAKTTRWDDWLKIAP